MFRLFKYFRKRDLLLLLVATGLIVFQVFLDLKMPDYMSEITRLVQTQGSDMGAIIENGLYMLACAGGSLVAAIIVGYMAANISASFSLEVRKALFDKIGSFSLAELKKFSVPSLITRSTNDITQIQMFIAMGLQMMIKAPITAVWAITKIMDKSWQWSAATAVAVLVLLSVIIMIMALVVPKFKSIQRLTDKLNSVTRESLTGIRVVRAFNAEEYQDQKFGQANWRLTKTQLFAQRMLSVLSPVMYLVLYFLTLAIYLIGADLINHAVLGGKLSLFADMVVFSSYAMQVIMSFLMLAFIFMMLPRAQVSANRINQVLRTKLSIKDGTMKVGQTSEAGTVEFRNVSFKYPDAEEYLLKDISFKAEPGQTVAFIGSTGSGKSTLVNLVPRFYDATDGEVFVDGVNVKDYTAESLHNKVGFVPQRAVIFSGTVSSNVTFGDNGHGRTSRSQVEQAVKVAQAQEFVEGLEDTYDSAIAQSGTNISGGQKQRLAIARAIARSPEIYVFDDSFSALDYKTDAALRADLKRHTKGATVLIVAQRIGTIMNADQIIVLDNGKCVGRGTHKELLKSCPVYKQIAESQLSKEEL